MTSCLLFRAQASSEKGSILKGKTFSGDKNNFDSCLPGSVSSPLNVRTIIYSIVSLRMPTIYWFSIYILYIFANVLQPIDFFVLSSGPSCSKLTMSLVSDSLKFTSSDTQICWNFLLKKCWVAFAVQELLTFFQQKISDYCILNPLKQLMKWPLTSSLS